MKTGQLLWAPISTSVKWSSFDLIHQLIINIQKETLEKLWLNGLGHWYPWQRVAKP